MGKNNKSRHNNTRNASPKQQPTDDYDVRRNFRNLNSYNHSVGNKRFKESMSYTEVSLNQLRDNEQFNTRSKSIDLGQSTSSGISSEYARLDDKLSDFDKSNSSAHNELRKELEGKIGGVVEKIGDDIKEIKEKYLPIRWYYNTITVLGVLVTVVYIFSYSSIINLPSEQKKFEDSISKKIEDVLEAEKKINERIDTVLVEGKKLKKETKR